MGITAFKYIYNYIYIDIFCFSGIDILEMIISLCFENGIMGGPPWRIWSQPSDRLISSWSFAKHSGESAKGPSQQASIVGPLRPACQTACKCKLYSSPTSCQPLYAVPFSEIEHLSSGLPVIELH